MRSLASTMVFGSPPAIGRCFSRVVGAADDVVVGLLGHVFLEGDERAVARDAVGRRASSPAGLRRRPWPRRSRQSTASASRGPGRPTRGTAPSTFWTMTGPSVSALKRARASASRAFDRSATTSRRSSGDQSSPELTATPASLLSGTSRSAARSRVPHAQTDRPFRRGAGPDHLQERQAAPRRATTRPAGCRRRVASGAWSGPSRCRSRGGAPRTATGRSGPRSAGGRSRRCPAGAAWSRPRTGRHRSGPARMPSPRSAGRRARSGVTGWPSWPSATGRAAATSSSPAASSVRWFTGVPPS